MHFTDERFYDHLAQHFRYRADREDLARSLIDSAIERDLLSVREAEDVGLLLALARDPDIDDFTRSERILRVVAAYEGTETVAGAIRDGAARVARSFLVAQEAEESPEGSNRHARARGAGGGDFPGNPADPLGLPDSRLTFGLAGGIFGAIIGAALGGPLGAVDGFLAGAAIGVIIGTWVDGDLSGPSEGDSGGDGGSGCFTGETPVLMANGSRKSIQSIGIGDLVMARDVRTRSTYPCPVTRIYCHDVGQLLMMKLEGGEVIETTPEHRFALSTGQFIGAGKLPPGSFLSTAGDDVAVMLDAKVRPDEARVYNLSVGQAHTYFVGEAGLWVHNVKDVHDPD